MAILAPAIGTLDLRCVRGEETMQGLDGAVVWFNWLLGEGWGREAVGNGVGRMSVRHHWFFYLVSDC